MARITLMEWERGVRFDHGRLAGVAGPGRLRYRRRRTSFVTVDLRPRVVVVAGQELLTADGIAVKISLVLRWQVTDPALFVQSTDVPGQAVYVEAQLALRGAVGGVGVDALLASRDELGDQVRAAAEPACAAYGVELLAVGVRDVMFPGELKRVFAQVLTARQEGLAALERARGEAAALRALANAARVLREQPELLQLRTLQAAAGAGATIVVTAPAASRD
jgi:regulator of protease activity HflC (stomatin/prohibitin superfamily)